MKWKNTKTIAHLIIVIVLGSITMSYAAATVDWNVLNTMQLEAAPMNVAVSPDGKRIFVLTEQGQILIYSSAGQLIDKIEVGNHFDHVTVGAKGALLILNSRKNKSVQVITLDFIQNINISGSPFKGSEDAAVVVVVFDDFE
jgi:DNA-binding beta-propeller fold protein YncE